VDDHGSFEAEARVQALEILKRRIVRLVRRLRVVRELRRGSEDVAVRVTGKRRRFEWHASGHE